MKLKNLCNISTYAPKFIALRGSNMERSDRLVLLANYGIIKV